MAVYQGILTVKRRPKDGDPGDPGEDGYSVSLSKAEHTFNYDKNGNLKGILSDGTISVEVLNGSNPLMCDSLAVSPPTLDGSYRVTNILISPSTTLSYNVDRLNNIFRIIPTMIVAEEVMVTFTIVARTKGVNTTFTRQLKYQKHHDGASGKDAVAPIIIDGFWAFWDDTLQDYVKSSFSAIGDDGHSPYIGANGNWYQWVPESGTYEDTGIKAKGDPGKDGDSVVHIYKQYPTKPATPPSGVLNPPGWSRNPDYILSIVNQTNWTVNGKWHQSEELTASGNSSTSRITFTTYKDAQTITLELWADGHATYDYLYAGKLDTDVSISNYRSIVVGGREIITYDVPTAGSHYIDIFWRKRIATIVGSNRGYYAIISDVKVWRSATNVIGGVAQDWSEPQRFDIDTSTEERIYCLSKTTTAPVISDSDAYINDYIPLPCSLSSYRGDFTTYRAYSIGQVVIYQFEYYKVVKTILSSSTRYPTDEEYFEKIPGWTDNPVGANIDYPFEFVAIRKKQADGLWGQFVSSVWTKWAKDGEPGNPGLPGQVPLQKEWVAGDTHRFNDEVKDFIYVKAANSNTLYWYTRTNKGDVTAGPAPVGGASVAGYTRVTGMEFLATRVLLAEEANLANFIFKKEQLISVKGTVNGEETNYSGQENFIPNLILDGAKGDVKITGTINAKSGKVGYLDIDAGGSLVLRDEEGETRLLITKENITPIADIGSNVQNSTVNNSQLHILYMLSGGVEYYVQGNKMLIMNNNTLLTISTSISISISTSSGFKLSQGRGRVTVWLRRIGFPDDNILLGEATVQVDKLSGEQSIDSSGVIPISESILVGTGTYEIAAEVWMEATAGDHYLYTLQGTLGASTMVAKFDAANRRTEIGKNGIGVIVNANNYTIMEGDTFEVRRGSSGLQITSSGIKKWNGTSWVTANI